MPFISTNWNEAIVSSGTGQTLGNSAVRETAESEETKFIPIFGSQETILLKIELQFPLNK